MKDNEEDYVSQIQISDSFESEEDFFGDVSESLKQQINEEFMSQEGAGTGPDGGEPMAKKKSKGKLALKIAGITILSLVLVAVFLLFTKPGKSILARIGGNYLSSRLDNADAENNTNGDLFTEEEPIINNDTGETSDIRRESYVANFLLMGIEEINGGGRTDSMMIASINTQDNTIKLTSIMRDCYVAIPGYKNNKLNAAYGNGGADLLIQTIEENFKIKIDGYASVNFESFEKIIDLLGGVDIELGKEEAAYLRTTNYISHEWERTVYEGKQTLTGNQALGYARVRKVKTLGGANNDFGRTLRQRRVLNAIFDKYKSKNVLDMLAIMNDVLPYVKTNLSSDKITQVLYAIMDNNIMTIENHRIPAEGCYHNERNERGDVLILDFDANIKELYKIIYLDQDQPEVSTGSALEVSPSAAVTSPAN